MADIVYAFVDGSYLRESVDRAMKEVFGVPGDLAPEFIAPEASRLYFYDCRDNLKRGAETEKEFNLRLETQDEVFSRMHNRPGLHLRFGTLKGERRRTQKEVDILLAVDMLTHGFNRNMKTAILIAGDLDFRPLVEAVVRGGTFVSVWYEKRTGARELPAAADLGHQITWHEMYGWNTLAFRDKHRPPSYVASSDPVAGPTYRSGLFESRPALMVKVPGPGCEQFILRIEASNGGVHRFVHTDPDVLERFAGVMLERPIQLK